ncbi:hypothetical protein MATL_G00033930 [Megalops atlanticus]|uniref:Serpin domain-containing protein n=1 Tax=Megalops atlanticus TaxID=7932 RepID=A0A9D3QFJ1_MEGAT|nr:hypothetical protein MATL_G00033930 [Megalops atlanticus]
MALHFDESTTIHSDFQALSSDINKPTASYILRLANRLYGEKTFDFLKEFIESTQKFYHADLVALNFIGAAEESRKQINQWVEEQTESKIKDLLQPGMATAMTRLALVNAIYFKGSWLHKFDRKDTKEMPFKISQNEIKPVQMMYQMKKFPFNYIPDYKLQILELPYQGEELSMFILLPEESGDNSRLRKLEKELTLQQIEEWTNRSNMDTNTDIIVHLPKFKLEENYTLNKPLARLGMTDVFDEVRADLSGMNGSGNLYVSTVVHKSFIEVNEEGTEAAAAMAWMVVLMCMPRREHFTADHPFLFFIRHNKSRSILFLGRFSSP